MDRGFFIKTRRFSVGATAWVGLALVLVLMMVPWVSVAGDKAALDQQLIGTAGRGDLPFVKSLLEKGADANAATEYGATALKKAVDSGGVGSVVRRMTDRIKEDGKLGRRVEVLDQRLVTRHQQTRPQQ